VPLFYDRSVDNFPREWIQRMKQCMRRLAPVFNTNRMVREYADNFYVPAVRRGTALGQDNLRRAIALAAAKDAYRHNWSGIRVIGVHTSGNGHYKVGDKLQVEAMLDLANFEPADVAVQLYAGPITASGDIEQPQVLVMQYAKEIGPSRHLFTGTIECRTSGRQGFAVRVVPGNPDLATPFEPGLIIWN
jgi:starch phosphorylase